MVGAPTTLPPNPHNLNAGRLTLVGLQGGKARGAGGLKVSEVRKAVTAVERILLRLRVDETDPRVRSPPIPIHPKPSQ